MATDELVDTIRRLTKELEVQGIVVFLGVLARVAWSRKWRLTIASPTVDKQGPLSSYPNLRRIVARELPAVLPDDVSLVSPNDPFVKEVSGWVRVTRGVVTQLGPMRLGETEFDFVYIFK